MYWSNSETDTRSMSNQAISGVHEQAATKKTKRAHNALNLRHVLHSMIHCIDKILLCSTTNFEATNVNYEILHFSFFLTNTVMIESLHTVLTTVPLCKDNLSTS